MKFVIWFLILISSMIQASPFDSTPLMFSSVAEFQSSFKYEKIYSSKKLSHLNIESISREELTSVQIMDPGMKFYNKSFVNRNYYNFIQYQYNMRYGPILFQAFDDAAVLFNNPAKLVSVVKLEFSESIIYAYVLLQKDLNFNKYYSYVVYNYRSEEDFKDKIWIYHFDDTYDFYFRFRFFNVERVSELTDENFNNMALFYHFFDPDRFYYFSRGTLYNGDDLIPDRKNIDFFNLSWRAGVVQLRALQPDSQVFKSIVLEDYELMPEAICSVPVPIDFSEIKDTAEDTIEEDDKRCPLQEEFFAVNRRYNILRRRYIVSNFFIHFWTGVFITSVVCSGVSLIGYGIVRFGLKNFDVSRILGIIFLSSGSVAIAALPVRFFVSVITSPIAVNFYEARDRRRELLNKLNFHINF